ncbi:ricin-type beta-trefoil lectin domain protein [Actinoplanes sp. CA-142083]|uniref:ricin-type beta-trefoil lectin domain protein n=1 Tax=Actinoplanes sp. CA-142083 TaxID=3239903 RepID=UPI003D8F8865
MTDDDHHDEERDPLLVRPYLLDGAGAPEADQSTQTWPSATTREVRSHRALEGADDPTAILPVVPAERPARNGRRRLVVLVAACAVVLLGAAVAGFAALRSSGRPSVSAALPDAPVPALSGLVPPSPAAPPVTASSSSTPRKSATRRADSTTVTTAAGAPASSSSAVTSSSAPGSTPAGVPGKTTSPPAALVPARTGTIRGQNGLCLDLNGAVVVDFNHIQVFTCNNTAAQRWTLATDGTVRVLDMCALIAGDDTVHITRCDGRTTAKWRTSGQLVINTANDKCLTDPSSGTAAGTAVRVVTCDGRANQRWSLP